MDELFGSLRYFLRPQSYTIDNHVFRLHYKWSVLFLVGFSIMVTARQYFGDPIDCISRDSIPGYLLDTYCWIHTTFSLESAWHKTVGVEVPYPGVDKYSAKSEGKRVYHAYYQWVCFVLFFQAIFFYVPHYLWKAAEGGKIKNLVLGLNNPIMQEEEKENSRKLLVGYLQRNIGQHNSSFLVYCVAEILNFVNVIGQMKLMDKFLGGEFSSYGWDVIRFTEWDWSVRYDPMIKVFPRLTKCTFHCYGTSGDVQRHDAMCILPINIINEKIYVFLWFWFYFLAVASLSAIIYRFIVILVPPVRPIITQSRCQMVNQQALAGVLSKMSVSDWFLLDLLSKNIQPMNFRDLMSDYYVELAIGKPVEIIRQDSFNQKFV